MDEPELKAVNIAAVSASKASASKWASLEDWERVKFLIRKLYVEEDRTLKEVMAIMSSKYGHNAT